MCIAQAASPRAAQWSSQLLSGVLSLSRRGGTSSFTAECTDSCGASARAASGRQGHGGEVSIVKDLLISLLVFALIFGGALVGMAVRPLLSDHHLHSDSRDVVKLTAGLIGTLTALVLGLLIASAKTTFDQ